MNERPNWKGTNTATRLVHLKCRGREVNMPLLKILNKACVCVCVGGGGGGGREGRWGGGFCCSNYLHYRLQTNNKKTVSGPTFFSV